MFYWLLVATSVAPYLIFPTIFAGQPPPNTETVRQTILFLANAHILGRMDFLGRAATVPKASPTASFG